MLRILYGRLPCEVPRNKKLWGMTRNTYSSGITTRLILSNRSHVVRRKSVFLPLGIRVCDLLRKTRSTQHRPVFFGVTKFIIIWFYMGLQLCKRKVDVLDTKPRHTKEH